MKRIKKFIPSGIVCLVVFFLLFGYLAFQMGTANMLNTIMRTAHDLLLLTPSREALQRLSPSRETAKKFLQKYNKLFKPRRFLSLFSFCVK